MTNNLRYARSEDLLNLALLMANNRQGVSLASIQEEFGIGRRTAERMRDSILRIFPHVIENRGDDRIKRWHIPRQNVNDLLSIASDDLAALHTAVKLAEANAMDDIAARLQNMSEKLKIRIDGKTLGRIEPDLEALIEAEGLAIRQGPKPAINTEHLEDIRHAIKGANEIVLTYTARGTGKTGTQQIQPYGFLYGSRHYLVAYNPEQEDFRLYSLPNIKKVKPTDKMFERQEGFDLEAYAARSFGVFQEDPVDVVWKVAPDAAADAREYLFHPTQKIEERADGSLLLRFTAGGMLEMCWELFKWGGSIEVVEPEELKKLYARILN